MTKNIDPKQRQINGIIQHVLSSRLFGFAPRIAGEPGKDASDGEERS